MAARYIFFYFMTGDEAAIREAAPQHTAYWQAQTLPRYIGGPLGNRLGGVITFAALSLARVQALVEADPFLQAGVLRGWLV